MMAPDFRRGYLRIPLSVWQRLFCRTALTRRQLQLVAVVLRESWGWQRKGGEVQLWTRPLTLAQLSVRTGLRSDHARRSLVRLVHSGLLEQRSARAGEQYRLALEHLLAYSTARAPLVDNPGDNRGEKAEDKRLPAYPKWGRSFPEMGRPAPGLKIKVIDNGSSREGDWRPVSPHARLIALVQFFLGPLSVSERRHLREWVRRDGAAAVWQALILVLRQEPERAHTELRRLLLIDGQNPGKETDA